MSPRPELHIEPKPVNWFDMVEFEIGLLGERVQTGECEKLEPLCCGNDDVTPRGSEAVGGRCQPRA